MKDKLTIKNNRRHKFYCKPLFHVMGVSNSWIYQTRVPAIFEKERLSLSLLCLRVVNLWAGPGRTVRPGPAEISGRNGPARPGPQKSWPGPGRSCSILFLSVFLRDFLMKIWTLLITRLKLSIFLSKKWRILAKSSRNIGKKRSGPARPGPVHSNLRAGTVPICQAWDLQPCCVSQNQA